MTIVKDRLPPRNPKPTLTRVLLAVAALSRDNLALLEAIAELAADNTPETPQPGPLLTTMALAKALSLSRDTVDRLAKSGTIPIASPKPRRFDLAEVRKALAARVPEPQAASTGVVLLSRRTAKGGR